MRNIYFYLIILFSCQKDEEIIHNSYDVILVIGQSNCLNGAYMDSVLDLNSEGIKQLGRFNDNNFEIIDAIEPLQNHDPRPNKIGFALTFAKLYQNEFNNKVLIIPCAKGNSGFIDNQWNRGNPLYNDAIERTKYVLNNIKGVKLKAILWQQGEKDILIHNPNYKLNLEDMLKNLLIDLGVENTKNTIILAGGMVPYWVSLNIKRQKIQEIISDINSLNPKAFYVNPELPYSIKKLDNNNDTVHYNADGLRIMGLRYFQTFKENI